MDWYAVLSVDRHADSPAIRRAYRRAALRAHPDKQGGSRDQFDLVSHAFSVLSDPQQRSVYDSRFAFKASADKARFKEKLRRDEARHAKREQRNLERLRLECELARLRLMEELERMRRDYEKSMRDLDQTEPEAISVRNNSSFVFADVEYSPEYEAATLQRLKTKTRISE